jgi:hypothetical protein
MSSAVSPSTFTNEQLTGQAFENMARQSDRIGHAK